MTESEASYCHNDNFLKFTNRKSISNAIFEFYYQLYYKINWEENSKLWQKGKVAIEGVIWCLQIISLLWLPDMSISNWNKNMIIWKIIGYVKFDNVCSELGIISECLILSVLFNCASFLIFISFFTAIYNSYSIPILILNIFRYLFSLWITFFFIPSIQLFTIFLKYNFFPQDKIAEYQNHNDSSEFEISLLCQIGIIFSMIFAMVLILLNTQFSGDIRHSLHKLIIIAKAHSLVDTHIAIFTYFWPVFYSILAKNFIIHLQILAIIFSAILIRETMVLRPYFSFYYSSIVILRLFFIAFVSLIFILGRLMDNSLVISILAIILGPLLSIFIVLFTKKSKITKNIPEDIQNINSEYELEKYLRHALCSNDFENKDKIIQIFENFFIDKKLNCSKLLAIWEANYCLFTLEDKTLANVKIAKNKEISDFNIEAHYQEYFCNKIISSNHLSDSLNFSNFFAEFQIAKRKDKDLCINLLSFLNEITSIKPNLKYLKKQLNSIDEDISVLNKQYSQLSLKYFNSKELLSLYASYAKDIIYDLEKSSLIEMKIKSFDQFFSSSIIDTSTFSFLNENNGILIISNEFENFGEILYANHKSAEILRLPLNNFINDNFFNFFHPYHKERIANGAKKFVQFSSSLETYLSQGFFLNLPNNLLECVGKLSVTVINNFIVSILIFREKEIKNQVALISDDYEIICHSANFQRFLGNPNNNFVGTNIKKLFFDSEEFDIKPFVAYKLPNFLDKMHLVYSYYEIYGIKVPYAILIKGDEAIKAWKIEELALNNKKEKLQVAGSLLSVKISDSFATSRTIRSFHKENHSEEDLESKIDLYRFTNEAPDEYDFSDKNDENKSQYSASSSQNKFLNMLQISSKSINILNLAFIFAVLTVLAVNIAVLVYAFSKINIISDVELPLYIGRAGKYFQQVALYSHMVFQCYASQMPEVIALVPDIFSRDVSSLADFETLYSNMTIKSKNWNHCSGQNIINDVNVDLWPTDGGVNPKKVNLVKAVAEFINHV
ncbi:unnamed protein product [Blepharisma stoltei]|uniref:TmcB/TmcC TPR repeats domain-containing protein n=1 Tax=Blepharisma stoltei TaxID=1481888 RepID=A0AAU9KPN9_9CILI|nr:unnamed protein product [Blepharisma stoltei]